MARLKVGNELGDFSSQLLYAGLQTLRLRSQKHMENGILIAKYLKAHPKIEKIIYPNLEECSVDIESY